MGDIWESQSPIRQVTRVHSLLFNQSSFSSFTKNDKYYKFTVLKSLYLKGLKYATV